MTHDSITSRLALSALPFIAACVFACGSGDGSDSDVPSFGGTQGTPGTSTDPNAPDPGTNGGDPTQPGGTSTTPGEAPVANGETPLTPGETGMTPPGGVT